MPSQATIDLENSLLSSLLADEAYYPAEPGSLEDAGLSAPFVEQLVLKLLGQSGTKHGRGIADALCVPFRVLEHVLGSLRNRQLIVHAGSAPFNDYYYSLTENGSRNVQALHRSCAYVGPAPVRLDDYILSVEAQSISAETPQQAHLRTALEGITIDENLFEQLGPAINSGAGMFLYGAPGNGKSTLARRITMCFGQEIWIPHAIIDAGQIIKVYDASYHETVREKKDGLLVGKDHDRRWVKIRRPTVVVGGEMTMDNLEIRHDPVSNVSEAPLQLKSNCGCLVIDDFGRQRVAPEDLLNRWIIPLENRQDFLTLSTGKKIQVPFDQLIIFSTNLDPNQLVDEAFMRRIPYKIEVGDPEVDEFQQLFQLSAAALGCDYRADAVDPLAGHSTITRCSVRCGDATHGTSSARSATIARTTENRWKCVPNTWIESSAVISPRSSGTNSCGQSLHETNAMNALTSSSNSLTAGVREPIPGYILRERIGTGGFGEVWKADAPGGLQKAVKIVFGDLSDARAARELKALERVRSVHHPMLLSLERIEAVDDHLVIVTELADMSLRDYYDQCREQGRPGIPRDELLGLFAGRRGRAGLSLRETFAPASGREAGEPAAGRRTGEGSRFWIDQGPSRQECFHRRRADAAVCRAGVVRRPPQSA